ncbi:hypothetical protein DES32_0841 [Methylovirgula ligni]|uniref:Uncharacterized protein n=1 Tax=Methylovirgula ligni TaxID=569860 RepID=A0A3D9Z363_9HYPH|nr:hypothetical protein DES32_0841 [Methylovirgula ligni]
MTTRVPRPTLERNSLKQMNNQKRYTEAEQAAIREEARAAIEAAKRKNLEKLRRAVIARLVEAGTK